MRTFFRKICLNLMNIICGIKIFQSFFRILHKISLRGMNYDRGHKPSRSGEPYVIDYILKKDPSKKIIFDVGANCGQYLNMILSKTQNSKNLDIHCFEPQKSAFIQLNNLAKGHDNIHLNNIGLGSVTGEMNLNKDSDSSVYASLYQSNYKQYNVNLTNKEKVSIDTLDQYCKKNKIQKIDLLKIDVEGHEIEVLKGAIELLSAGSIKNIQFEFGLASIESRIFLKDFFEVLTDYQIFRVLPKSLHPLENYSEYHEIFLTTNYLAVYTKKKIDFI